MQLLNELALPGLTAVFLAFTAWREARKAKAEVMRVPPQTGGSQSTAMVAAVSMAWDRDQQERFLQHMERIARSLELTLAETKKVATAQESLANQQQLELQEKMDMLLEQMKRIPAS